MWEPLVRNWKRKAKKVKKTKKKKQISVLCRLEKKNSLLMVTLAMFVLKEKGI